MDKQNDIRAQVIWVCQGKIKNIWHKDCYIKNEIITIKRQRRSNEITIRQA